MSEEAVQINSLDVELPSEQTEASRIDLDKILGERGQVKEEEMETLVKELARLMGYDPQKESICLCSAINGFVRDSLQARGVPALTVQGGEVLCRNKKVLPHVLSVVEMEDGYAVFDASLSVLDYPVIWKGSIKELKEKVLREFGGEWDEFNEQEICEKLDSWKDQQGATT